MQADGRQAARLILSHFPDDHESILQHLQEQPELQYKYLLGALQVILELDSTGLLLSPGWTPVCLVWTMAACSTFFFAEAGGLVKVSASSRAAHHHV